MDVTAEDVGEVLYGWTELIPNKNIIIDAIKDSDINNGGEHDWDVHSFAYGLETGMIIAIKKLGREDLLLDT